MRSTVSRDVSIATCCSTMGVTSCDSTGNTWRNHPTAPAMVRIAPRMLTEAAVTIPAAMSVSPKASTRGQTVGAGISIFSGVCMASPLNSDHVNNREDDHPNRVDEVPVHRQDLHPPGVLALKLGGETEHRYCNESREPHGHV